MDSFHVHSSPSEPKRKRFFSILHSKLVFDIDLKLQTLKGFAELTIQPQTRKLYDTKLQLCFRQSLVSRVLIDEVETQFEIHNFLEQIVPDSERHASSEVFKDYYKAAIFASDDGELLITLPPFLQQNFKSSGKHPIFKVKIEYRLVQPKGSLYFVSPDPAAFPDREYYCFVHNEIVGGARMWFPCIDNQSERCTFEMQYTVDSDLTVVSSGELQEQTFNEDKSKKTVSYKLETPTLANCISFAVGPFTSIEDNTRSYVTSFALPHLSKELQYTTSFISNVFNFYEEWLGFNFPYKSYKQVFVDEAYSDVSSFASIGILSSHFLHDKSIIDQTYESRYMIAYTLALQWFGNYISTKTWCDSWIYAGLAGYLAYLFYQHSFGINDSKIRLIKDAQDIFAEDLEHPLYHYYYIHPSEITHSKNFAKKATLVMYMIAKRIGEDTFRKVVSNLVTSTTEEEGRAERYINTHKFFKGIKRVSGQDLSKSSFSNLWIYGTGYPTLSCAFWFNKKKHVVEFALRQEKSTAGKIMGALTLRVNEIDGKYDHVAHFDDDLHCFDFPCHSRVRKNRRKKKTEDGMEEEEPERKQDIPVSWVRVDPDLEFPLFDINFKQFESMWHQQVKHDDAVAQYFAIRELKNFCHSFKSLGVLEETLQDEQCFYKIRGEAAFALAKSHAVGFDMLFKFFKEKYYDGQFIKANDFTNISSYFVQMSTIEAISTLQDKDDRTSDEVLEFLLDLLDRNDNNHNNYSDNYYLAAILRSIANVNTGSEHDDEKINKQYDRFLSIEKLIPSYRGVINIACIQGITKMQKEKRRDLNLDQLKQYISYGNYEETRVEAVKSLLSLGWDRKLFLELLDIIEFDKVSSFKYKVADLICKLGKEQFEQFRSNTSENLALIQRIWALLNSSFTAYDHRLRYSVSNLFEKVWGRTIPRLLENYNQKMPMKRPASTLKRKIAQIEQPSKPASPSLTNSSGKLKIVVKRELLERDKPKPKKRSFSKVHIKLCDEDTKQEMSLVKRQLE